MLALQGAGGCGQATELAACGRGGEAPLLEQAEVDFTDFGLVANATWEVDGDHLVLRIPLRP